MQAITTLGLDIAKSVFQVHGAMRLAILVILICCQLKPAFTVPHSFRSCHRA